MKQMIRHHKAQITVFICILLLTIFASTYPAVAWGPIAHYYINSDVGSPSEGVWNQKVFNTNSTGPDIFTLLMGDTSNAVRLAHAPIPSYYRSKDGSVEKSWNNRPNFAYLMWQINGKEDRYSPSYNAAMGWGGHIAADWVAHDRSLFQITDDDKDSAFAYHVAGELAYDYYVLVKYKRGAPITSFEYQPDLIWRTLVNAEYIYLKTESGDPELTDYKLRNQAISTVPDKNTIWWLSVDYSEAIWAEQAAFATRLARHPADLILIPTPNGAETNLNMAITSAIDWVRNPTSYDSIPAFDPIHFNSLAYNVFPQLMNSNVAYAAESAILSETDRITPDEAQAQFWYRVGERAKALGAFQVVEEATIDEWGEPVVKLETTTLDTNAFDVAFQQIVDEDSQKPNTSPEYMMAMFAERFVVDGENEQHVLLDFTPPAVTDTTPVDFFSPLSLRPTLSALVEDLPGTTGYSGIDDTGITMTLDGIPVPYEYLRELNLVRYEPDSDLSPGIHHVSLSVEDKAHNRAIKAWSFTIDPTPPTTTASLDPLQPNGANNWYTSDVTVSLLAEDNGGGSGVAKTEYTLDNGQTWTVYGSPLIISTEGTNKILYRSTDMAGNTEDPKEIPFKIDKTAPTAPVILSPQDGASLDEQSTVEGQAESLSEVNVIIDGTVAGTATADMLGRWQVGIILSPGAHVIAAVAVDEAGNMSPSSQPVSVLVRYTTTLRIGADSASSGQYSDDVSLSAALSGGTGPVAGEEVAFTIGSQTVSATTGSDGIARATLTLSQPAGTYDLTIGFVGDETYRESGITSSFVIEKEDLVLTYIGDTIASTVGIPILRAQLVDVDSGAPIVNRPITLTLGNQSLTVVSDSAGMATGALVINQPQGIYQTQVAYAGDGYYNQASAIHSYFVIYNPFSGQKTTGGGWVMNGVGKCNFGFNAEYKNGGAIPIGELQYKDHGNGTNIRLLSYAWLVFTGKTAALEGTCSLNGGSGYTFRLEISDIGEPGKDKDRFKLVVTDSQGVLRYSVDGTINQGNIQVH